MKKIILCALVLSSFTSFSDESTNELLISKLERVNLNLAPNDPSKVAVTLRLADLLSEKARLATMKDLEAGCTICTAGEKDRARALALYQEVLPRVPLANLGRVLIQMGHLHEMNGNTKEAIAFYEKTRKEVTEPQLKAEASLSLAEVYFKKNQFSQALDHYLDVLKEKTASSRGLAAYRAAWCSFHLSQLPKATAQLKEILITPALQSRSGLSEAQADPQFLEEIARDLASFLAKQPFQMKEIEELVALSPASTKQQNLTMMALELERLGKKREAKEVWTFALSRESKPEARLEALVHLVPLSYEEKNTEEVLAQLIRVSTLWTELRGCGKSDCADEQKILRGFLVNWNQTEKKAPSENLVKGYGLFVGLFSHDLEVMIWAAEAAKHRKDFVQSSHFLSLAATEAKKQQANEKLENILLSHLEVTEASQDKGLWKKAADFYLMMSEKQTKAFEVRYQLAKQMYDQGDALHSAQALYGLAQDEKAPLNLRIQSANLSLDALVLTKDESRLAEWSFLFSQKFTGKESAEFVTIYQKTILTKVAELAKENPEAAYLALEKFDLKKASAEDQKTFLRNKMILAEKTNRLAIASITADEYLALSNLNLEEKDFALGKKSWLAEIRLDFSTALKSLQQMPQKSVNPDQKALKLALYSDLAGVAQHSYYQQFLQLSKDEVAKRSVAAELIRKNKDPEKEFEKNRGLLAKDQELLARISAEIFVKTGKEQFLKKANADTQIQKTAWGKTMARYALLKEILPYQEKLSSLQLDSKNQKMLTKSIKLRGQEIGKFEALTAKAIAAGDWSSQVVALSILAKESKRFYEELMALPMPEGLTPEEEGQYMQLLSQQSAPYQNRAQEAAAKLKEFWSVSGWKEALQKSVQDAGEFQMFVTLELEALSKIADQQDREFFAQLQGQIQNQREQKVAMTSLEEARNEVRANPFNREKIEKLKSLESQMKNFAMVQYLEGRLQNLEEKKQ